MKTGMEYPLLGLVLLVILVLLWNAWSGLQLDLSVASLNATVAGTEAPEPVLIAGQWIVKAIVGTLLSGVVIAGATALVTWLRKQWRQQNANKAKWQPGPNANWGRQPQPRPVSEAELMRMWMMQQLGGNSRPASGSLPQIVEKNDDEPTLTF
ncbi:MAG: hypothetical protein NT121_19385 [Chloroflexi bacterium]|nr:hypothetical protein [Chloroflexota bacterium]